ncbi:MAG: efflux RND transporter periplasmic adaptor subunit [Planctomycetes bacterium]|nr:efflux RND transporter periplasmic adaptor subunit [Planctomycetota bacterium]
MSDTQLAPEALTTTPIPAPPGSRARRVAGRLWRLVPATVALAGLAGVLYAGQSNGWKLPRASALRGDDVREPDDWCKEHNVPDSICVECKRQLLPRPSGTGWCKEFGVHDCPHCDPAVAQTPTPASFGPADLERARRALAFAPRPPNGKKCKLHEHRVQLASGELVERLGIGIEPVGTAPIVEGVTAPGEIGYDPTRLARLSARLPGVVRRVERQVGDRVKAGDVLALVDAAEVGKSKAEFQQALVLVELRAQTLAQKKLLVRTVPGQVVIEAEAALDEARVRLLLAEQSLANLGLPVRADEVKNFSPAEVAVRLRFLGVPDPLKTELAKETASANLLPVRAPFDGEVVARAAAPGQPADPAKPLFAVADTTRVWLTLRVRYEDADRVKAGRTVRFRADQGAAADGVVAWVSPAADEKTRTVPVRVELSDPDGRLRAGTFGTGFVVLRSEDNAVVVPTDAVHWEGCCNVVFVADRGFDQPDGYKVFHVRKVRPGARDVTPAGVPVTEVIAGVLPGERVAVAGSGVLRAELLRNNLGAG